MKNQVKIELDVKNTVGESITWDYRNNKLVWIDIITGKIFAWQPDSKDLQTWDVPGIVTSIGLRKAGGYIVGLQNSIKFWSPEEGLSDFISIESDKPENRLNEGIVGPDGAYWVGTMQNNINEDGSPKENIGSTGAFHRITVDGGVTQISDNSFGITNTIIWADNRLIVADTVENEIYSFAIDPQTSMLTDRIIILKDYDRGLPDGSCMDAEGYIWNCRVCGGSALLRLSPDGEIDRVIELPCSWPTSCNFGGENLDRLYVTTARFTMDNEHLTANPQEGSLLSLDVGVKGIKANQFG